MQDWTFLCFGTELSDERLMRKKVVEKHISCKYASIIKFHYKIGWVANVELVYFSKNALAFWCNIFFTANVFCSKHAYGRKGTA